MSSHPDLSERHVPLDGCLNMRDLGGVDTADGAQVARGLIYRSADLHELTDADLDIIDDLGISVVFDLRGATERDARPSRLRSSVEVHEREMPSAQPGHIETLEEQIAAGTLPERDDELLTGMYTRHLDSALVPEFGRILGLAADARTRPLLFHCTAGKDRTGLAAAILLGVLGVPDETILLDYELTTEFWSVPRLTSLQPVMVRHGVREEGVLHLLEARATCMQRALVHLHDRWGGYERYVVDGLGLGPDFPARLRSALVEQR